MPRPSPFYVTQWLGSDDSSSSREDNETFDFTSYKRHKAPERDRESSADEDTSYSPETVASDPLCTNSNKTFGPLLRQPHSLVFRNFMKGVLKMPLIEQKPIGATDFSDYEFASDESEDEFLNERPSTSQKPMRVGYETLINHDNNLRLKAVEHVKKFLGTSLAEVTDILRRHSEFDLENLQKPTPPKKIYKMYDVAMVQQASFQPPESSDLENCESDHASSTEEPEESEESPLQQPRKTRDKTMKKPHTKQPVENLFGNVETTAIDVADTLGLRDSDSSVDNMPPVKRRRRIFRQHNGFKCTICSKQFKLNWMLRSHQRVHTGEKPFKCEVCEVRFADSSNLTAHMRQLNHHTWEYKCEVCQKPFSKATYLRRHNPTACEKYLKKHSSASCGSRTPQSKYRDIM